MSEDTCGVPVGKRLEVEAEKASGGLWDLVFLVFFEVEAVSFGVLDLGFTVSEVAFAFEIGERKNEAIGGGVEG